MKKFVLVIATLLAVAAISEAMCGHQRQRGRILGHRRSNCAPAVAQAPPMMVMRVQMVQSVSSCGVSRAASCGGILARRRQGCAGAQSQDGSIQQAPEKIAPATKKP